MSFTNTEQTPAAPERPRATLVALAQLNMGRVLNPLVRFFTAISFYFYLREFLSASYVMRYNVDPAYIVLLTAYAGLRELRRWVPDPEVIEERARRGELFVAFWWIFYAVTLVSANHLAAYRVPDGLFSLCVQVTTIFFGTLASQQIYKGRAVKAPKAEEGQTLESRILAYIHQATVPVRRRELEDRFQTSRSVLQRILDRLESQGHIEWTGEGPTDPAGGFRPKTGSLPKPG